MIDFEPAGDVKMNFHGSLHPLDGATTGSAPEIMVQSTIHRSDELAKGLFEMIDREFATGVSVAAEHAVNSIVTLMAWTDPIPGSPEVLAALTGCARGAEGSTAAAHADGVAIAQAEWVPETGGDILELYPGEVLPVSVFLVADSGIPRGDYPFITTILAQDTPH